MNRSVVADGRTTFDDFPLCTQSGRAWRENYFAACPLMMKRANSAETFAAFPPPRPPWQHVCIYVQLRGLRSRKSDDSSSVNVLNNCERL